MGTCVKTAHSIANGSVPVPVFDEFFNDWFPDLARAMALIVRDLSDGQEIAQASGCEETVRAMTSR